MLFDRLSEIVSAGGDLFRAESEILVQRARASALGAAVVLGLGGVAMIGALGVLVAGTAWLSQSIGWIGAVAVISGLMLAVGGVGTLVAARRLKEESERSAASDEARRLSYQARLLLTEGSTMNDRTHAESAPPQSTKDDVVERVTEYVTKNPHVVAAGVFAVLSVLGPGRTLRLVSRGSMLAGLANSLYQQSKSQGGDGGQGELFPEHE